MTTSAERGGSSGSADVRVLIPEPELRARVTSMGADVTRDYRGKPLVVIGVLKGSFIFLADLVRAIDLPLSVDFIGISSYQGTRSTGVVQITSDLTRPIEGKEVLLVEDIVDTGLTMRYLLDNLATRRPASVRVAALLEKPARAQVKIPIDYRGFEIADEFVVGYGLDRDGELRNLPFIGVVRVK
jgi:hypoxanthine phosphoribosyltransferase